MTSWPGDLLGAGPWDPGILIKTYTANKSYPNYIMYLTSYTEIGGNIVFFCI